MPSNFPFSHAWYIWILHSASICNAIVYHITTTILLQTFNCLFSVLRCVFSILRLSTSAFRLLFSDLSSLISTSRSSISSFRSLTSTLRSSFSFMRTLFFSSSWVVSEVTCTAPCINDPLVSSTLKCTTFKIYSLHYFKSNFYYIIYMTRFYKTDPNHTSDKI